MRGHWRRYLTNGTKIISHNSKDLIKFVSLFVLERVEMLGLIDNRTENVPMLLIIVKFDVAFKRDYISLLILQEKLLNSLNEYWNTSLSEDLKEGAVSLWNKLGHHHIDGLTRTVQLIRGVAEHMTKLSIRIDNLSKLMISALDQEEPTLVDIWVELILIVIILQCFVHALNLLHLEHVLRVLIITV